MNVCRWVLNFLNKTVIALFRGADVDLREVLRGSALAFVIKIAAAIAAFGMNVAISRLLGVDQAGLFFLAYTIVFILASLCRLGLDQTLVRFIAARHAMEDWAGLRLVFSLGMSWTFLAAISTAMLLWLFADVLAVHAFHRPEFASVLRIGAPVIPVMALFNLQARALQGVKRIVQSQSLFSLNLPLGLTVPLMLFTPTDARTATGLLLVSATLTLCIGLWWWRTVPHGIVPAEKIDTHAILASCLPLLAVVALNQTVTWSSQILLGIWTAPAEVAIFNAAQRTALLISLVLIAVNSIAAPKFAAMYRLGQRESLRKTAINSTRMMLLFALVPFALIQFGAEWILWLFGAEFQAGAGVLRILALGQFINVATGSVGSLLSMTGHERLLRNNVAVAAVIALGGGVLLIPLYGLIGAAIATAAGLATQNLLCVWQVRRVLGFNTLAIWPQTKRQRLDRNQTQPAAGKANPKPGAKKTATQTERGPIMSILFSLVAVLALITSLILALIYWPGNSVYWEDFNPAHYRESILWGLGGLLIAVFFVGLAQVLRDLRIITNATLTKQNQDQKSTEG